METKIPPPIVTLAFGLSIYFSRGMFPAFEASHSFYLGIFLLFLGFFILVSAVRLFRKDKTTVNRDSRLNWYSAQIRMSVSKQLIPHLKNLFRTKIKKS